MKDVYYIASGKRAILKPGMRLVLAEDCEHGDYKTASVRKDKWPTLKKGTEVVLIKMWENLYGIQCRIRAPSGELYDIEPRKIECINIRMRGELKEE